MGKERKIGSKSIEDVGFWILLEQLKSAQAVEENTAEETKEIGLA
jgi:hypothetical protein